MVVSWGNSDTDRVQSKEVRRGKEAGRGSCNEKEAARSWRGPSRFTGESLQTL